MVTPGAMLKSTSASALPWVTPVPPTTITPTRWGWVAGYRPPWLPTFCVPSLGFAVVTSTLS